MSDNRTDYTQGFQAGYDYAIKAGINQGIDLVLQVLEDEGFPKHGIGHIIRLVDAKKLLVPSQVIQRHAEKSGNVQSEV